MGTQGRNKISMDAASDDSLSFTGLVCLQEQLPMPPPSKRAYNDPEFEFGTPTPDSSIEDLTRDSHPATIVSDNQLLHHAILWNAKQYEVNTKLDTKGSLPVTRANSKGSSHSNRDSTKVSDESRFKWRNRETKEKTASRSGFGWKFWQFIFPCRECQAAEPKVKANAVVERSEKLH